jgi:hypothetical protein
VKLLAEIEVWHTGYDHTRVRIATDAREVDGEWVFENFEATEDLDVYHRTQAEEVLADLLEWHRKRKGPDLDEEAHQ